MHAYTAYFSDGKNLSISAFSYREAWERIEEILLEKGDLETSIVRIKEPPKKAKAIARQKCEFITQVEAEAFAMMVQEGLCNSNR